MEIQKVTVTGWVDLEKVLKTVGRNGRQAELWQFQYNADYQDFNQYYNYDQYQFQSNPTAYSSSEYNPICITITSMGTMYMNTVMSIKMLTRVLSPLNQLLLCSVMKILVLVR